MIHKMILLVVYLVLLIAVNSGLASRSITDCEFVYNLNSNYSVCIPRFSAMGVRKFDVCSEATVIDGRQVHAGFVHSPGYPEYYGNSRNCRIDLRVPDRTRLVLYAVRVSMEAESYVHGKPNDYVRVSDASGRLDVVYCGQHHVPKLVYEGVGASELQAESLSMSSSSVRISFRSDWITTQRLTLPKGFLLYFEFLSTETTTSPTTTSTTTSTTTTTESTVTTKTTTVTVHDSFEEENVNVEQEHNGGNHHGSVAVNNDEFDSNNNEVIHTISAKIQRGHRHGDHLIGIVVVLVGIIGVLVLIIFGLLLMFRRKQHECEEDTIYDTHDSKSMGSTTIYADDYVSSASSTGTMTSPPPPPSTNGLGGKSSRRLNNHHHECKCSAAGQTSTPARFNERLKKLYHSLNKTISMSTHVMNVGSTSKHSSEKKLADEDEIETTNVKVTNTMLDKTAAVRNMNEYSSVVHGGPATTATGVGCELKVENERLFRATPSTPASRKTSTGSMVTGENAYVASASTPVQVSQTTAGANAAAAAAAAGLDPGQLNIYEVDFDNNVAYIVPSVVVLATKNSSSEDDAEIYQAINDSELETRNDYDDDDDDVQGLIATRSAADNDDEDNNSNSSDEDNEEEQHEDDDDEMIYSTPSNKLIETISTETTKPEQSPTSTQITTTTPETETVASADTTTVSSTSDGDDRSMLHLVQHDNNETPA